MGTTMRTQGNTILITGGGSGIGRALAHRWHDRGNRVIVVGRTLSALEETANSRPGIDCYVLDIADTGAFKAVARRIIGDHPALNVVVNNAGASFEEDPTSARNLAD